MDLDDSDCVLEGKRKAFYLTTKWKALIITVGLLIAIVISFTAISSINKECKIAKSEMCLSPSCINKASNLVNSLDMEVDPCDDFYSFVCGNWIKNTLSISSQNNRFTEVATSILLRVKEILENLDEDEDLPEHKKKTRDFYKACTNQGVRNLLGALELNIDQGDLGGWPVITEDWSAEDFDWADVMIRLFKKGYASYNMFFSIYVDSDVMNTSQTLISINLPSLGLYQSQYYDTELHERLIDGYKILILELAMKLNSSISKEKSMRDIEEAFEIEYKIANLMKDFDSRNPDEYYNIRTLKDIEIDTPKIPWRRLLQNLLPPETNLKSDERIMVANPILIKGINDIFKEMDSITGKRIIANYMFYRMVLNAAYFLSDDIYDLTKEVFESLISRGHHSHHGYQISIMSPIESELLCSKLTMSLFPLSVTASYAAKYMDNKTKNELEVMFENLRNSLTDRIRNTGWLDYKTKDWALLKIRKMLAAVAYEDEIMDDKKLNSFYSNVNMTEYHFLNVKRMIAFRHRRSMEGLHETRIRFKWTNVENLLDANAYYQPTENSITIPVGVLQGAIFAPGIPNYVKYGSLGTIIGHELNHAFDSFGSLYDDEGNYRMLWSSRRSLETYLEKLECYKEQYSSYHLDVGSQEIPLNGAQTLDENVADNSGLQTAYYAYKTLLQSTGSEKSLPGLTFNEKQMFWISFASVWCEKEKVDALKSLLTDEHTPSKFRVIGTLSNMKEFSEDFGCKLDSVMQPSERCSLWA